MKLIYSLVLGLLLTSSTLWANHSIHCGSATAKRSFQERRLLSRFAVALKTAAEKKHPTYPWRFELIWAESIGYLWQEQVTKTLLMIKGDKIAFTAPLDDAREHQWTEIRFPERLKKFWISSIQSKDVLTANREVLAQWFTRSVYPILISHDFEKAANVLKERELSPQEFSHLVSRVSLVNSVLEVPPYELKNLLGKRIHFRIAAPETAKHTDDFVIHTHARFPSAADSKAFLELFTGEEVTSTRGDWRNGHLYGYDAPSLSGNVYSIQHQRKAYPNDPLTDLLFGLPESEGEKLLDFFPATGHFSLRNESDHSVKDRQIWKAYLERLILVHGLTPIIEDVL